MIGLHLRRGLGIWVFLPLVVAGWFSAQGYLDGGTALWPLSASALGLSVQLMGPLAAGAAAYAGGNARRQGTQVWERLSALGQGPAAVAELGALLAWVVLAFVVVLARVYVPTALEATWGGPPVLRTVAVLLGLCTITCCAFIFGRVVPYRLTPLGAAIATYALITLLYSGRGYSLGLFSPVDLNVYDQFRGPSTSAAISQIAWYTGITALVVLLWVSRRAVTRWVPIALAAAAIATISAGAAVADQHGKAYAAAVLDVWNCTGTNPQICVHPAYRDATATITTELQPVLQRLAGTPFAVTRVEQRPRGVGSTPTPGAVGFALDDLRPSSIQAVAADVGVNALGLSIENCTGPDGNLLDSFYLTEIITTYVVTGSTTDYQGFTPTEKTAATAFGALTPAAKTTWLTTHQEQLPACTLTGTDFP